MIKIKTIINHCIS